MDDHKPLVRPRCPLLGDISIRGPLEPVVLSSDLHDRRADHLDSLELDVREIQ